MSGFFAVRREVLLAAAPNLSSGRLQDPARPRRLAPARTSRSPRSATPSACAARAQSKLDQIVALEYVELLLDKTIGRFIPVKLVQFGAIGSVGVASTCAALFAAQRGGRRLLLRAGGRGARRDDLQLRAQQPLHLSRPPVEGRGLGHRPARPSSACARSAPSPMSASAASSMIACPNGGSPASRAPSSGRCGTTWRVRG